MAAQPGMASSADATSIARPTDGIARPGNEPPPATASVSTTLAPGTRKVSDSARAVNASSGAVAIRQSGMRLASPSR